MNKKLIFKPITTEKSSRMSVNNQYVFKVSPCTNKGQVKKMIEQAFKVKVASVKVLNVLGKSRRFGAIEGKRKDWKKAYVSLMDGFSINLENTQDQ